MEFVALDSFLSSVKEVAASLPPAKKFYSYGTAGFRDQYTESMHIVFFKVGIIAALRSLVTASNIGVMVTASHNAKEDNGVKIVDPDGGMLTQSWEKAAEGLVNGTVEEFIERLKTFITENKIDLSAGHAFVTTGQDCRSHSNILTSYVKQGVEIVNNGKVFHIGEVTTPVVHFVVALLNQERPTDLETLSVSDYHAKYYETLLSGYTDLLATSTTPIEKKSSVILDTAYGVGSVVTEAFLAHANHTLPGWDITLRNRVHEGDVNDQSGAEHVQKGQIPPIGVSAEQDAQQLLCSFDGDGDRIVFHAYLRHHDPTSWILLDGDRIAALIAVFLHTELSLLGLLDQVTFGVVQTAYANGASTKFLRDKGVKIYITKTGVKYLHHQAQKLDIGIYFEANGHGTVIFSDHFKRTLARVEAGDDARKQLAIRRLQAALRVINPTVGDALSDLLCSLAMLTVLDMDYVAWNAIYTELPSKQVKLAVRDKSLLQCSEDETYLLAPTSLQDTLYTLMETIPQARCFVRPSGTEDVVRIYAEAASKDAVDTLVQSTRQAIDDFFASTSS